VPIGVINKTGIKAIRMLNSIAAVEQEVRTDPSEFSNCIKRWKEKGNAEFHFEINLYGPLSMKEHVGETLSKCKCYLRMPLSVPENITVENPHWITFENLATQHEELLNDDSSIAIDKISNVLTVNTSEVFEGLDQRNSQKIEVDEAYIRSKLLE
jgi:hypothetical protein